MSRPYTPKVITANALLSGEAVWFTAQDGWSRDIARAELLEDEAHADLRLLEAQAQRDKVAGVYLAEVKRGAKGPEPLHFREAFRTRGPSNYFHGKQAE
jgi:hypothetical protein